MVSVNKKHFQSEYCWASRPHLTFFLLTLAIFLWSYWSLRITWINLAPSNIFYIKLTGKRGFNNELWLWRMLIWRNVLSNPVCLYALIYLVSMIYITLRMDIIKICLNIYNMNDNLINLWYLVITVNIKLINCRHLKIGFNTKKNNSWFISHFNCFKVLIKINTKISKCWIFVTHFSTIYF